LPGSATQGPVGATLRKLTVGKPQTDVAWYGPPKFATNVYQHDVAPLSMIDRFGTLFARAPQKTMTWETSGKCVQLQSVRPTGGFIERRPINSTLSGKSRHDAAGYQSHGDDFWRRDPQLYRSGRSYRRGPLRSEKRLAQARARDRRHECRRVPRAGFRG